MSKSSIEWTEDTWNPVVGCSILSPGCTNCYAMKEAYRFGFNPQLERYHGLTRLVNGKPVWTGVLHQAPESTLLQPLKRKKPTRYFVNSMSDLFHEDCPDEWIDKVFAVMSLSRQHTFQVLTKRAKRMREYCNRFRNHVTVTSREDGYSIARIAIEPGAITNVWPLPNVWLGVSAERQQEADERIPLLLATPAAVRFISAEPLLGPIDLTQIKLQGIVDPLDAFDGRTWCRPPSLNGKKFYSGLSNGRGKLDWVIVGGESGPGSRPMHPDWARSLRDQCSAAGVPFFFKQWGEWFPCAGDEQRAHPKALRSNPDNHEAAWPDGTVGNGNHRKNGGMGYPLLRVGKKAAGRSLDGMIHNEYPAGAR